MNECGRQVKAHGWCEMHWRRLQKTGDPLGMKQLNKYMPLLERFAASYSVAESGCWIWTRSIRSARAGYGAFRLNGKQISAHRASFLLFKGEIADGLCVLHTCDVRRCVNPDHLFLGTTQENSDDKVNKGRHTRGTMIKAAKLTDSDVFLIRSSTENSSILSNKFGVNPSTICKIKRRVTWKHLSDLGAS